MRKALLLSALFAVAACSRGDEPDPKQPAEGDEHIACAVDGQAEFANVCAVDLAQVEGKKIVVVRHPGGGFRRFEFFTDGRGLASSGGAEEAQVVPNGPAATSGLQPGDVILDFNGTPIHESSALPPMVGVHPVGQPAKVTILRRGETRVMELMIGELPEDTEVTDKGDAQERPNKPNRIGLIVEDLIDEDRDQLGVGKSGVFVAKVEKGPAERAGIRVGDILLMVDNKEVESVSKLRELLDTIEPGRSVAALIQRNEGRIFVAVRLPKD